jgi:hypothetical protein
MCGKERVETEILMVENESRVNINKNLKAVYGNDVYRSVLSHSTK